VNSIITDKQLTQFIQRTEEAADAYVRGDMDDYLRLVHHARGFTLLAPYGGPATRHEDRATEIRSSAALFHSGEARLEHVETHAWGDTVVLAMIERQHGEIGDSPDQEWPLRVTHVYRRDGPIGSWCTVTLIHSSARSGSRCWPRWRNTQLISRLMERRGYRGPRLRVVVLALVRPMPRG
jgi:ketosteroid isomerase-like protein